MSPPSYLVQILLPKETGNGQPISHQWFEAVLKELTEKFGGATSFLRAPGQGLWQSGGTTEKDNIAVIEVMADELDQAFWRSLRRRLQEEGVARSLQETGIIKYARGKIRILDADALHDSACECYESVKQHYDRMLGRGQQPYLVASSTSRDTER